MLVAQNSRACVPRTVNGTGQQRPPVVPLETEVAHAVAHLKAARAHAAAAGQSLDHTALEFLDAHDAKAPTGAKVRRKKKAGRDPTKPKRAMSGYQLFMEATRPTITDAKGKEVMSRLAKMWREMDEVSQKPWNDKARAGQEKAKADFERWKGMSPDERLVHFPPSPSLGPSPPPPPPADAKPSKKRAKSEDGSEKKKKKKKKKRASSADPDADTQL